MNKIIFITIVLSVVAVSEGNENEYYTIVAPSSFRPNSRYRMSLAATGLKEPMDVLITLTDGTFKQEKLATIVPNSPTVAFLDIGNLERSPYKYKLQVQSLNGIKISETARLVLNTKESSILIQTDKAIYKPSDRIQFRVLVVDGDTKPMDLNNQPVEAYIEDPKGNKIKQWQNIKMQNGVFKSDLKLSREPAIGEWILYFSHGSNENKVVRSKNLAVAEYVLPKFEIITSQPVFNTFESGKLIFGVEAKYTFGKPVKGSVTVRMNNGAYDEWDPHMSVGPEPLRYIYKIIPIDGKATVEIDLKELSLSSTSYTKQEFIGITVLEELTGIAITKEISMPIYVLDYNIGYSGNPQFFRPGLTYSFNILVFRPDNTPISDTKNPVKVTFNYGYSDKEKREYSYKLDDQGQAFVSVTVPLSATMLYFVAQYRNAKIQSFHMSRVVSESNNFIEANILTKPMDINKFVRVQVKATEPIKYFYYQIIGKGGVLASHRKNIPNSKVFVFSVWATFAMVPEASLVVYYYRPNGEIVADQVKLKFESRLDNYANITLSATQLQPAETVDITVDTKCNSYVGLLGIDQSVSLLRSGNDINKQNVLRELLQYNIRGGRYPDTPTVDLEKFHLQWKSAYTALTESGAIFLTNANKYDIKEGKFYAGGPAGAGGGGGSGALTISANGADSTRVRRDFPETWIWEDIMNENCDPVKLSKKVPDTITSWLISAFSLNQANGLGLNENPTSLTVFRPFFISITLPYSVKRGERLTLSIQIFNYLSSDQDVLVTMFNEAQQFDFTDDSDANYEDNKSRMNLVTVKANTGSTLAFTVTPRKVGYLPIKVTARCEVAGDAIEQLLFVETEGSPVYVNKAVLLDLRTINTKSVTFTIETPDVALPESTSAKVAVYGDVLGNTILNLDRLIIIPTGCGEQNMILFVPNLLVAVYLSAVQQLTTELQVKIVANLEIGYQQELNYQRSDGSFSCFGKSDSSGSTWLTAFVVRYFAEAKAFIKIDERVMIRAMDWLVARQSENGRFNEVGRVVHQELRADMGGEVALTSHVLLALLANNAANKYDDAIKKATSYITEQLKTVDQLYTLAISAYALQKQGHSSASAILKRLNEKAIEKDGLKWWDYYSTKSKMDWWDIVSNINIEITALAMTTHVEAGLDNEAYPIMQWLIKQQNSLGGYSSTQDTIWSIQALAKFASKLYVKDTDIDVAISYAPDGLYNVKVTRDNAMASQSYVLPLNTKTIKFDCKGTGFAVAQVAYKYYVLVPEPAPRFYLDVKIRDSSTAKKLDLTICNSFIPDEKIKTSNMAIVEIAFPSGYTFNRDILDKLRTSSEVSRVETRNLDTVLIVYYYSVGEKEVCFGAEAVKTSNVALLKPALARVYDYYDNSKQAKVFYDVSSLNGPLN